MLGQIGAVIRRTRLASDQNYSTIKPLPAQGFRRYLTRCSGTNDDGRPATTSLRSRLGDHGRTRQGDVDIFALHANFIPVQSVERGRFQQCASGNVKHRLVPGANQPLPAQYTLVQGSLGMRTHVARCVPSISQSNQYAPYFTNLEGPHRGHGVELRPPGNRMLMFLERSHLSHGVPKATSAPVRAVRPL